VTCRNVENSETYRTIFLDLEGLYFEVESKAQGNREKLLKKKDKKLAIDETLHKAATEFVLARLNIGSEPLSWPDFTPVPVPPSEVDVSEEGTNSATMQAKTNSTTAGSEALKGDADLLESVYKERMCTFNKLANDMFEGLELNKPTTCSYTSDTVPFLQLTPKNSKDTGTIPCIIGNDPTNSNSEVNTSVPLAASSNSSSSSSSGGGGAGDGDGEVVAAAPIVAPNTKISTGAPATAATAVLSTSAVLPPTAKPAPAAGSLQGPVTTKPGGQRATIVGAKTATGGASVAKKAGGGTIKNNKVAPMA
jgi:hypothetical protein